MIEEGLLDRAGKPVDAAYACTSTRRRAVRQSASRRGPTGAAADEVKVACVGAGGHGSDRTGPRTRSRWPAKW